MLDLNLEDNDVISSRHFRADHIDVYFMTFKGHPVWTVGSSLGYGSDVSNLLHVYKSITTFDWAT